MAESIRILLADEDPDSRVAARKAIIRAGLVVSGEAGFGTDAVATALKAPPDAVLVAVEEPAARPLDTAAALADALPGTPIIVYSSANDAAAVRRSMLAGARNHIPRPLQAAEIRDAVFHALEQEERRQLRQSGQLQATQGRGTVITVAGAKGGIGKTVVAVNLALALREQTGKRVAIVDADTQFGDVATMLDLPVNRPLDEIVAGSGPLGRDYVAEWVTPDPIGGLDIIGAANAEDWEGPAIARWAEFMDAVASFYEFVVVDTSGSFDRFTRAAVESSTMTLVVTSGEVSSIRDTAAALKRLARWEVPADRVALVLNRSSRANGVKPEDVERATGRELFWQLPQDEAVVRSVQLGRPAVESAERSAFAASISAMARALAGTKRSLVETPSAGSLRSKLGSITRIGWRGNDKQVAPEELVAPLREL